MASVSASHQPYADASAATSSAILPAAQAPATYNPRCQTAKSTDCRNPNRSARNAIRRPHRGIPVRHRASKGPVPERSRLRQRSRRVRRWRRADPFPVPQRFPAAARSPRLVTASKAQSPAIAARRPRRSRGLLEDARDIRNDNLHFSAAVGAARGEFGRWPEQPRPQRRNRLIALSERQRPTLLHIKVGVRFAGKKQRALDRRSRGTALPKRQDGRVGLLTEFGAIRILPRLWRRNCKGWARSAH